MADDVSKSARARYTRPIEMADLEIAALKLSRSLQVFVAGPFIEKGWTEEDRKNKDPAAILRIALTEHIEGNLNHKVVYGEHRGVEEVADERLRSRSSPVVMEMALVKKTCEAVIIVPASPGSFSELGAWSTHEDVCRKMLILANIKFEGGGGYLNLGVFKTAVDNGASLIWIDYTDLAGASEVVGDYISRVEDAELARSIMHG